MSGEHTQGPWMAIHDKSAGVQDCFYIHSEGDRLVPRITTVFVNHGMFARAKADAQLIATAPDLLKALKAVVAVADRSTVEFDNARAAIAKAEGAP